METRDGLKLDESATELASEIESRSGVPITFRRYTFAEKRRMPLTTKYAAANLTPDLKATICFPSSLVDKRACIHELLHLERWLVLGVPQITPNPDGRLANSDGYFRLENDLEHLAIVPRERELTESGDYWEKELLAAVRRWRPVGNIRLDLLLNAALTRLLIGDAEATELCQHQLDRHNLAEDAKRFCDFLRAHSSKAEQIAGAMRFLNLSPLDWQLQYFDTRQRNVRISDITSLLAPS